MKKNILIALLFIGGLTACNDSDNEQPENLESVNIFVCSDELAIPNALGYPVTNFSQIKLSEIKTGDAQPVTLTQTYDYEAGRIASFTSLQKFAAGGESFEIENITDVIYEDHKVIVTDEINNVSVWADLNSKLMAMGTDNDKAIAATDTKLATAQITLNQITEKYDAEKASLEVQKAGLNCILGTMKKALPQTGDNNQPLSTYEDAIKYLKDEIAKIEGAPSEVDNESGNITVKSGTLAEAKAELNMYDALLKALQDGSYEQEQATAIKLKEAQIDAKTFEIEALTVLFNKAKEMKDQLIKTLTGDTSAE